MSEVIVMPDSADAAKYRTDIKGWVSRKGIFYGEDGERIARWDGCTHVACSSCGTPTEKSRTKCATCRDIADMERYEAMLCAEWDGKAMLYSDSRDEYYSDTEAAHDDLEDGESIEDLRLVICEPNYARQIDKDFFCDEMTEDGDLPHEVINAMSAFNKAISGIVLSWFPGRRRLKITEQEQGK